MPKEKFTGTLQQMLERYINTHTIVLILTFQFLGIFNINCAQLTRIHRNKPHIFAGLCRTIKQVSARLIYNNLCQYFFYPNCTVRHGEVQVCDLYRFDCAPLHRFMHASGNLYVFCDNLTGQRAIQGEINLALGSLSYNSFLTNLHGLRNGKYR